MTAQAMAAGEGYSYLGIPYLARPPGFSALLIAPLQLFGLDFHALNWFVSLFGAAGVALLYFHQRPRLGPILSGLVCASIWLMPAYQKLCTRVMSDVPGLALLVACLLLERWAARAAPSPSWRRELMLGVAIGLSSLVRSMNFLLLLAIIAARGFEWFRGVRGGQRGLSLSGMIGRRVVFLVLGAILVLLPWSIRNEVVSPPSPTDQVTVYDYPTGMWHKDFGDPLSPRVAIGEVLERIPRRLTQLAHVLGSAMQLNANGDRPPSHPVAPIHALSAIALMLGLLYALAKHRGHAEFFAVGALLTISVYFGFQNRLVLPVYVIAFAATVEMCRDALTRIAPPRVAIGIVSLALLALLSWNLDLRPGWDRIRERHTSFENDVSALAQRIGPESCLASSAGFHLALYLGRPVHSLQMAVRRQGSLQAIETVIDKYGINTLALFGDKKMEREILAWAKVHYPPGEPVGTGTLFRVRAGEAPCGSPHQGVSAQESKR